MVQRHLARAQVERHGLCLSSTSTMTSWPRVSKLWRSKVSRCGSWSNRWLLGMTAIAPFAAWLGVSATQAVATSGADRPQ
jgi:hypothetical protein